MPGLKYISVLVVGVCLSGVTLWGQGKTQPPHFAPPASRGQAKPGGRHIGDWLRRNKNLPPTQQLRALENDPDFKKLPEEQQARLRERLQQFNSMPPDQQQRVLQRMDKWEHMSPEEKQKARSLWDRIRTFPDERRGMVRRAFHSLT